MKNSSHKNNSLKACQKLNSACVNLEVATDSLIDRIHSISLKINDMPLKKIKN